MKIKRHHTATFSDFIDISDVSYLFQALSSERVIPALHVFPRKFVLAEDSHCLAFFTASNCLYHFVKVGFVAFILKDTNDNDEIRVYITVNREEYQLTTFQQVSSLIKLLLRIGS